MVPASFVFLETLPLTNNGKVDRKALPSPIYMRPDFDQDFEEPQTQTERELAAIWAEVLRLDRDRPPPNFFELGGHSLLATQVISRIRKTFQVELPLRAIFETPTVAGLANRLRRARGEETRGVPRWFGSLSDGPYRLSFAQQRLWFLHQLDPESPAYNIPLALRLTGFLDTRRAGAEPAGDRASP